ncbi:MAG: NAD(P)H-dependent oxidoreductase subunit E [Fimbriimonadaceae bacterium]|jgi:NADH-quinone oxidoreductase E subunit|nr:NAD(P)H-dependent oxidoreductase subunit E [Fimbriimonadaceae bacterium]
MSELIQLGSPKERPTAPSADELNLRFSEQAISELEALKTHYPTLKACILPALWIAQREYGGFLDGDAIAEVAHRLKRSYAEVQGVATFYTMYNTQHRPGRHKIEVCTCLSCHFNSAYRMRDYITKKLGIKHGETTPDGEFMLEEVECLNACDRAPVIQVGDQYHGPVDEAYIDRLLENLRSSSENTVVRMADQIVQVQLLDKERTGKIL